jgi:methionyl-tRNA formyltransferase
MLKVVFAGTPEFAKIALQAIIAAGHEVVLVMTQPDRPAGRGMQLQASPVKALALTKNIPVLQPTSLRINGKYADEAKEALKVLNDTSFDVMVVAAYGLLLPQEVFDIAETSGRAGCLNIHASILPRWRGAAPIHRAIEAGDKETGISIMQMDLGLDTGAVIAKKAIDISEEDTTGSLHDHLAILGGEMIVNALADFEKNRVLPSTPQEAAGTTYANKILKEESRINWSESAQKIDLKIRAFNPFPGATFQNGEELIKVWHSKYLGDKTNAPSGALLAIEKSGVVVAAAGETIRLTELQKPGGKRVAAYQLAQSMGWQVGHQFI